MNYIHTAGIMHRDLKPENLLLEKDEDNPKIKIIDFGTACTFKTGDWLQQKYGTPYYIAPEVLKKKYNEKCDIWSAGVILYILLCGYPPFNGQNDRQIIEAVLKGKFTLDGKDSLSTVEPEWDDVSPEAKDIVKKMLEYEPGKRISAEDAIQHPWIKKMATTAKIEKTIAAKTLQNLKNFRVNLISLLQVKLKTQIGSFGLHRQSTFDSR